MRRLWTAGVALGAAVQLTVPLARRGGDDDGAYCGNVSIGDPPQAFELLFDTGSGNLVVPVAACRAAGCVGKRRYAREESSTGREIAYSHSVKAKFDIADDSRALLHVEYGTGKVVGVLQRDTVCVGGRCTELRFLAARNLSAAPFATAPFDGLLGLSLPQLAEGPGFSIVDAFIRDLDAPMVALAFAPAAFVHFGSDASERCAGSIVWEPVAAPGYWQVTGTILVGDVVVWRGPVAVDSGTRLLAAPSYIVSDLAKAADVRSDCANVDSRPALTVRLASGDLRVPAAAYVRGPRPDLAPCGVRAMPLTVGTPPVGPLFILGEPFLVAFQAILDRQLWRVGFCRTTWTGEE